MNIDKRKYNRFLAQDDAFAALGFTIVLSPVLQDFIGCLIHYNVLRKSVM